MYVTIDFFAWKGVMSMKKPLFMITMFVVMISLSSCALFGAAIDDLNRYLNGMSGTMSTYDQFGRPIDVVRGQSFDMRRDETFDTSDSEGNSNKDSSVVKVSVGDSVINHVGSTLILAEEGLIKVSDAPTQVELENSDSGRPWLNYLYQHGRNLWQGKSRTIMIRSQNGTPIAVFAGNTVETFNPDIPKTTWFRVDGKTLLVYRADYTVYDTELLGQG